MFEPIEHKSFARRLIFYVFVAALTIIVMASYTINFKASLGEEERCGYEACTQVVNNADPSKAQLLSCRCQCESTQVLTEECTQAYECFRADACWRLKQK